MSHLNPFEKSLNIQYEDHPHEAYQNDVSKHQKIDGNQFRNSDFFVDPT
jgi:hypothetical protein